MRNLSIVVLLFVTIGFFSTGCKKKNKNQYSHWHVNADSFSSNNVSYSNAKNGIYIQGEEGNSHFEINYYSNETNAYHLFCMGDNPYDPTYFNLAIYYNDISYAPSSSYEGTIVYLNFINNKVQLILSPMWFVNYDNPTDGDSVLISGVFNQP